MQATPVFWMMEDSTLRPSPVRLSVGEDTRGGTLKRCQRCDIPLGSRPCPNPLCHEQHGQSVGEVCAWCRHTQEEPLDGLDEVPLHDSTLAVCQCAAAYVG